MQPTSILKRILVSTVMLAAVACTPADVGTDETAIQNEAVFAGGELLEGVLLDETTDLKVFRGVPFAAPPTGERRWRPPAPHTPRSGMQAADAFGPACPQLQGNHDWYRKVAELFGNPPETIGPLEDIDEDCLTLNVWTENAGGAQKRPVMVWIYGGSNRNGYANEPNYHGNELARRGVVFVSLNYRVGVMGYLAHAGLSAESEKGVAGNYGILDQVAALKWVQENIAAFGGDSDNVTVFGESAGAANSGTLMASPLAAGLLHRVISQSGGYQVRRLLLQADAEAKGSIIAAHLGFDDSTSDADTVAGLRELSWQDVVTGAASADVDRYTTAVVDGYVLPDAQDKIFQRGEHNDADLLIGANANEGYMYLPTDITREQAEQRIREAGADRADELMALLANDMAIDHRLALDRLSGAASFLCPSKFMAAAVDEHGGDAFFYHFTRIRPGGEKILAYHGAEIPYALETADDWLPGDETDARLSDTMAQYWVNFATTGSPNGAGLPEWPQFSAENSEYMELGETVAPGLHLEDELCSILNHQF